MQVTFKAFTDQRPGTAGLRKKVSVFQQPHYLESFLEAVFRCVPEMQGQTVLVGGDGRYYNDIAIQTIVRMARAHGIRRLIVGQHGYLSTPAASHLIREKKCAGGFLLTASHNPAGPEGDFGIKFNTASGGQASEQLTEAIYQCSLGLKSYEISESLEFDLSRIGVTEMSGLTIEVVDPVADYAQLMAQLFDFEKIRNLFADGFSCRFDAMHAITGPYARQILATELGMPDEWIMNSQPKADFAGGHPDPNLVHAQALVQLMMSDAAPDFGAASDGDGDRNMILGANEFVSPGDSLAVLAANLHRFPGYHTGLQGVARSMPTSRAVDKVAEKLALPCYETPTGWRFFCNLLEDGRIGICGEESFGTSSIHAREKDGLWAVLAWLNLLALEKKSLSEIMHAHWQQYGRHYYQRHDYENLETETADRIIQGVIDQLEALVGKELCGQIVTTADEFSYHDPVDGSVSEHQGVRIVMGNAARIVIRLSGTGTSGATLRVYLERYEQDEVGMQPESALAELSEAACNLLQMKALAGKEKPDLVT